MGYIDRPYPDEFEGAWQHAETMDPAVEVSEHDPVFTGVYNASGDPIMRHPVKVRFGFYPETKKYHIPSLRDDEEHDDGAIVGWHYEY